jgi:hypothetical protein
MGNLLPGEELIYERVDDTVYARYVNKPEIPRWVVGGKPKPLFSQHSEFLELLKVAERTPALQKALDKVALIWYTIKDDERSKQNF